MNIRVHSLTKFHVFSVNPENFQSANNVWDADVDFSVEPAETSEGRVDAVGSVRGCHDDDVGAFLHTVHQSQQL